MAACRVLGSCRLSRKGARNYFVRSVIFFLELADSTKPYSIRHSTLSRYLTFNVRMDSLYYDVNYDRLPHEAYNLSFALNLVPEVHLFAREVWKEIRT